MGNGAFMPCGQSLFRNSNLWLDQYRQLWEARLDRFGSALKKKQQTNTLPKKKRHS